MVNNWPDIKKVEQFSPGESTFEGIRLQRLRWWCDPEIKWPRKDGRLHLENGPLIKLRNAWWKVKMLKSAFLPGCLILSCNFALIFSHIYQNIILWFSSFWTELWIYSCLSFFTNRKHCVVLHIWLWPRFLSRGSRCQRTPLWNPWNLGR